MSIKAFKSNQSGSSLIEVMVALFVLAIGLLGVLSMQVNAVKMSRSSALVSQANALTMDIYEAMKASPRDDADQYQRLYNEPVPALPTCATTVGGCSSSGQIADANLHYWLTSIASSLPAGRGQVQYDASTRAVNILIEFTDGYEESSEATGEDVTDVVKYVARLDTIL